MSSDMWVNSFIVTGNQECQNESIKFILIDLGKTKNNLTQMDHFLIL